MAKSVCGRPNIYVAAVLRMCRTSVCMCVVRGLGGDAVVRCGLYIYTEGDSRTLRSGGEWTDGGEIRGRGEAVEDKETETDKETDVPTGIMWRREKADIGYHYTSRNVG